MTPKEKAKELYDKMLQWHTDGHIFIERNITSISTKRLALIAVDELIKYIHSDKRANSPMDEEYWQQVKQEIEKL